jgi:hypothetical protein
MIRAFDDGDREGDVPSSSTTWTCDGASNLCIPGRICGIQAEAVQIASGRDKALVGAVVHLFSQLEPPQAEWQKAQTTDFATS